MLLAYFVRLLLQNIEKYSKMDENRCNIYGKDLYKRRGAGMEEMLNRISIEQFKNLIKTLDTSMNDYLYIMDLQNDYYCISKNAAVRFLLPGAEFYNVAENLRQVIYADDLQAVLDDVQMIKEGKKQFHDIQYRWLDQEHRAIWINCRGRVTCDENGKPEFLIGCINEVGRKQMQIMSAAC